MRKITAPVLALVLALAIASPATAAETHGPASFGARVLALVETIAAKITSALRPVPAEPANVDRSSFLLDPDG